MGVLFYLIMFLPPSFFCTHIAGVMLPTFQEFEQRILYFNGNSVVFCNIWSFGIIWFAIRRFPFYTDLSELSIARKANLLKY